jgi:hypothetical protein
LHCYSSILTHGYIDKFPHIGRQFCLEADRFSADRMNETEFGRVQCLAGETEPLENRA